MGATPLVMVPDPSDESTRPEAGDPQAGKDAEALAAEAKGEAPDSAASENRRVDHDLVRRAQTGDEAAFASLVQRHQRRAWRVARNLVPRDEDADDIVQEAFLRVFRSLERFDFDYGFTTWLFRIVTNLAIDHLRKRRPIGIGGSGGRGDDDEDGPGLEPEDERIERPDEALLRDERARLVRECIDALAPHFRSVMVLRELDGLPCAEIAEIVGATHVTVRWRLHRGRKLFQDEWERRMQEIERNSGGSAHAGEKGPVDPGEPT